MKCQKQLIMLLGVEKGDYYRLLYNIQGNSNWTFTIEISETIYKLGQSCAI